MAGNMMRERKHRKMQEFLHAPPIAASSTAASSSGCVSVPVCMHMRAGRAGGRHSKAISGHGHTFEPALAPILSRARGAGYEHRQALGDAPCLRASDGRGPALTWLDSAIKHGHPVKANPQDVNRR